MTQKDTCVSLNETVALPRSTTNLVQKVTLSFSLPVCVLQLCTDFSVFFLNVVLVVRSMKVDPFAEYGDV